MARMRIGDMLVKVGLIDEMQLSSGLAHQRQFGGQLGDVLIEKGFVDEMMLYRGLAKQLGVELVELPTRLPSRGVVDIVPREVCKKNMLIAIAGDERGVTIAMSDPSSIDAIDEVGFKTGRSVTIVLAPAREIQWAHQRFFNGSTRDCPPPKTKAAASEAGGMEIFHRGGERHRVPTNPRMQDLPPDPTLHVGEPVMSSDPTLHVGEPIMSSEAPDGGELEGVAASLDESTHLLRLLVDTCVSRGVFTREEYLERVRRG